MLTPHQVVVHALNICSPPVRVRAPGGVIFKHTVRRNHESAAAAARVHVYITSKVLDRILTLLGIAASRQAEQERSRDCSARCQEMHA